MKRVRRVLAHVLCATALLAAAPGGAAAQDSPADTAQVLYDVAIDLERDGQTELAAAIYELILSRYPGSSVAAAARQRLAAGRAKRPEEDGRTELMVWGALYGLWLGFGVPAALDAMEPEAYGLGLLVGGPAGLMAAHAYTRDRFVGEGEARTLTLGGTWGTWQGMGWQSVLDVGIETMEACPGAPGTSCYTAREDGTQELITAGIVGGLAGLAVAEVVVRASDDITPGTSTLVDFGALWGTYYGFSLAEIFDVGEPDVAPGGGDGDATLTWMLLGGDVGLIATALAAPRWEMSRSRARLINIAGVAGLVAGLGLDLLLLSDTNADDAVIAIPMVASMAGLAIGAVTTRDDAAGPGAEPDAPGAGAMLEWGRRSGLVLNPPLPLPTLLPGGPAADARPGPGLRLRVFEARF